MANAGRPPASHIPALPQQRAGSSFCPLSARYRPAFVTAARQTNMPLAMLGRFQSPDLALAAYNAGQTAVARAGRAPLATLTYVEKIDAVWRELRGCR